MSDYKPIPCSVYDRYEIAILHHTPLRTSWRDPTGVTHIETLQPLDLITRGGEEFLRARKADGQTIQLRLDYILEAVPLHQNP
ncbi:MAG: transcriptional antiterminator, Rof [Gammaproteobacteria bacterium]